jgi:hypothetical protein
MTEEKVLSKHPLGKSGKNISKEKLRTAQASNHFSIGR